MITHPFIIANMGSILSIMATYGKSTACFTFALALTVYNRYQSSKYRRAVDEREAEGRSKETPKTKDFFPLQLDIGAPKRTLIQGGPDTPLLAFTDSLGLEIATYHWPATNGDKDGPVVMLCHGLDVNAESEFCIRPGHHWEGSWQKHLCDAGFNVYGWDHHGMGRSESVMVSDHRTVCYNFDDYVDVAVQCRKIVGSRHPNSKIFMHGQSLGGCVAIRTAERHPTLFDGLSLACPAVYLEKVKQKPINKILLPLVDVLKIIVPWLRVGAKEPHPRKDVVAEAHKIGPPMFNGESPTPASFAGALLVAADRSIADTLKLKDLPIHFMHAIEDPFVDYKGSEIMYNLLKQEGAKDVTLYNTFDDPMHDIVQTKDSQKCAGVLVKWLVKRV